MADRHARVARPSATAAQSRRRPPCPEQAIVLRQPRRVRTGEVDELMDKVSASACGRTQFRFGTPAASRKLSLRSKAHQSVPTTDLARVSPLLSARLLALQLRPCDPAGTAVIVPGSLPRLSVAGEPVPRDGPRLAPSAATNCRRRRRRASRSDPAPGLVAARARDTPTVRSTVTGPLSDAYVRAMRWTRR